MAEKNVRTRVRIPLDGSNRDVLTVRLKDSDQYVPRWVNDVGNRLQRFIEAGYVPCTAEHLLGGVGDLKVDSSNPVGSAIVKDVGLGVKAVLMLQRREDYEEDQARKQRHIDEIEAQMREDALAQNELRSGKLDITRR